MDAMEYKGYRGVVRYSAEDRLLHGRILGIEADNFPNEDKYLLHFNNPTVKKPEFYY